MCENLEILDSNADSLYQVLEMHFASGKNHDRQRLFVEFVHVHYMARPPWP
jgi:hypothetical protein